MTNAGDLMPEGDASTGSGQHRPEHQFWLTMQAAHAQWVNATEALDYLVAAAPVDGPSPDERLRIARAAEEQRTSFEEYVEARLAFSEFQAAQFQAVQLQSARDRVAVAEAAGGEDPEQVYHEIALGPWTLRTTSRFALAALGIALLCPAVFGLTYVMHERKNVRDLVAARDAMSALLTQARTQTQVAAQQAARDSGAATASRERPCAEETGDDTGNRRALEACRDAAPATGKGRRPGPPDYPAKERGVHADAFLALLAHRACPGVAA